MTIEVQNEKRDEKRNERNENTSTMYKVRCFLAQFVATTVENMLLFDMGIIQNFPFIIIAALSGISNEYNLKEQLVLTALQASWLGSIGYIFEPIGAIISAAITDVLGRKMAMIITNFPIIIGWFIMYNSDTVLEIFIATVLLGFGAGLMESPVITYVGEICDPTFRGIMIAYTHIGYTLGMLFVSVLNTLMPWRSVAFVCIFVPVITAVVLLFAPETPLWLLSKNRTKEAEKSLRWLRGWVSKERVTDELQAMQRYSQRYKSCNTCIKQNQNCSHPPPTWIEKLSELKRKQTLKPFFIVMALFFIAAFSGVFAMTPFIVQIFKAYESPMAPDQAAALLNVVNNLSNILFLLLIRFTGKRYLYLSMLTIVFLCSATICVYGFIFLPTGYNSFDQTLEFSLGNKQLTYIPFVCILLWSFCSYCGVKTMPWQMLSEVFPYKTRGTATGLTAALNYLVCFVATKTYYDFETAFSLPGMALFNCIVIAAGLILMYKILPETENRSLEDIELHFSDNSKKITDRKIPKISNESKSEMNNASLEKDGLSKVHDKTGVMNHGFVAES